VARDDGPYHDGCLADDGSEDGNGGAGPSFSSPAFTAGTAIPATYTCDGDDLSPPLRLRGTPDTETLALVVADPDVVVDDDFVHGLIWNIPPEIEDIPEGVPRDWTVETLGGAVQGTNDFGALGYSGPCPQPGDGNHTYQFTVQLLDTRLDLAPGTDSGTYRAAVETHVRGEATITGKYER
jgi:Raf kinase inhibitor-like YbhB/YbcL family protein